MNKYFPSINVISPVITATFPNLVFSLPFEYTILRMANRDTKLVGPH